MEEKDDDLKLVDDLFDAWLSNNMERIISLSGIDEHDSQYFDIKTYDLCLIALKNITGSMNLKQKEYLMSFLDGSKQEACLQLLGYSSGFSEEIKKIIEREDLHEAFYEKGPSGIEMVERQLSDLVCATADSKYIEKFIDKYQGKINKYDAANLVEAIDDKIFIEKCIKGNPLSSRSFLLRIPNYPDNFCYMSPDYYLKLLKKMDNPQLITDLLTDSRGIANRIKSSSIAEFLKETKDLSLIKESIETGMINGKTFTSGDLRSLVVSTNDKEYIVSCIERAKELNIVRDNPNDDEKIKNANNYNLVVMILATNDPEYIKACIKRDDLDLGIQERIILAARIGDQEYLKTNIPNINQDNVIDLPESMTIGTEIEFVGLFGKQIKSLRSLYGWECKRDESLYDLDYLYGEEYRYRKKGVEIVSPILTGNKLTTEAINNIGNFLSATGNIANSTCGGHIHIGADYLNTPEAMKNFLSITSNCEGLLYLISNKSGEVPRKSTSFYAMAFSQKISKKIDEGSWNINDIGSISELKDYILSTQGTSRNQGINFLNLANGGKGTIEFRFPNGSLDPNVWIQNINLVGGIVAISRELAEIRSREPNITVEEQEKLETFSKLISDREDGRPRDSEEKLDLLLKLAIRDERKRSIYTDRYVKNFQLAKDDPSCSHIIELLGKKSIPVTPRDVAQVGLIGKDAPTSGDLNEVNGILENTRNRRERV